jgi:flagellar hook-associated protein 2
MASTIQFSGLASGLDTSSIISSLMEVEAAPQNALKRRLATAQSEVSALQQVNTALASLASSAQSFAAGSTWSRLAATSSSSAITVTASSSAIPASFSLSVDHPATAASTTVTAAALAAAPGTAFTLSGNGTTTTVESGGSLAILASAINATTKTSGVQAHLVHSTSGDVLLLDSTATGSSTSFSLTNADGTTFAAATGTNASVTLNGGITVESSTNTFTSLMPGIDVTLGANASSGTATSIAVTADGASRATAMKAFIGQLNDVLAQIGSTTAYGSITAGQASTGGGALPGDSTLRAVADQLVNVVFPGGTASMAEYGVSIDRYGRFTFDADTFESSYEADPDAVQAAFIGAGSFTARIATVADLASDPYDGSISGYLQNHHTEIDRYQDQIAAWDDRLAAKQASLQQIYTALETQLSRLQAQQSWLTSQIESLDGLSGSTKN